MKNSSFMHFEMMFYRRQREIIRNFFRNYNLKFFEGALLISISHSPGANQGELSCRMLADESSVARSLRTLEKLELIYRTEDPENHRKKLVFPTKRATKLYGEFKNVFTDWNNLLYKGLSAEDIATLDELFSKLEKNFEQIDFDKVMKKLEK